MTSSSRGRWWGRKDVRRIVQRHAHGSTGLTPAERDYLRHWALLLLASDLDLADVDLTRLRWIVNDLTRERAA